MANELALSPELEAILFDPNLASGRGSKREFPPVVNILQSDKQYEAFGEEANAITKAMYGKLFVRSKRGNSISDLRDSITGTVISIQEGVDIYNDAGEIVGSSKVMIPNNQKDIWQAQNPGLEAKNMNKIIIALGSPEEVADTIKMGENPFAVVTIKGGDWSTWIEAQNKMDQLTLQNAQLGHKHWGEVLVSLFKITVKSTEMKGEKYTYYAKDLDVELNPVAVAAGYAQYVLEAKEIDLFYNVQDMISKDKAATKEVFADIEQPTLMATEEKVDFLDGLRAEKIAKVIDRDEESLLSSMPADVAMAIRVQADDPELIKVQSDEIDEDDLPF